MFRLTGFLCLLARHDPRRGLANHKWAVTLLQRAQKVRALLGHIRSFGVVAALADAVASRIAPRLAE